MAHWHCIGKATDLAEGDIVAHEIDGKPICVARSNGEFYAFDETCTHAHVSLADGMIEGTEVECPAHGARFDLKSGKACCLPATEALCTYPVKQEGDDLYVDVSGTENKVVSGTA